MRTKRMWVGLVAAGSLLLATSSWAATVDFVEQGDAGDLLATAQWTGTTAGNILASISGNLSLTDENDVDMFAIHIFDTAGFSAKTIGLAGGVLDPQLFLFDRFGNGVISNDDADASTFESSLGGFSGAAGLYFLAINRSDNDPLDAIGEWIFDTFDEDEDGNTDELTVDALADGLAAGLFGPDYLYPVGALAGWDGGGSIAFDEDTGELIDGAAYRIELTGAAPVPEPGTMILLGSGLVGLAGARRRRKNV